MSKAKRTALVTGASGLAGSYMLAHLLEQGSWDVIAVSRRGLGKSPICLSSPRCKKISVHF
jgi:nucleoside-diphosphate-sugar epimerase